MNSTETTSVHAEYRDLTPDEWLAGYFNGLVGSVGDKNVVDASRKRKNWDFLRLRDVGIHLLELTPGKRVLDIGCSNGATMIYCGLQGATVSGQDLDPIAVADANRQLRRYRIAGEAKVGDARKLDFADNTFDAVISSDFVEHIDDETKIAMLREARRVLKPGCPLVTKTPNLAYLGMALHYKRLRALLKLESPFGIRIPHTPGTPDPQHIGLATRWSFTRCLVAAGFLNYQYYYAPLRRFGTSMAMEILSTEVPLVRDLLCEELFVRAYKPICASHFPD
jgi:2-polyprenyl-3-methyl-5-hydroxy-6-metoxy-1,4-benzoquinol methylase